MADDERRRNLGKKKEKGQVEQQSAHLLKVGHIHYYESI
jgi:hypothetical protein